MSQASPTPLSLGMTAFTASQLAAIAAVFAEDADGSPGERQLREMALARGVDELYQQYVRGTPFDLHRQRAEKRARERRRGLHLV